MKTLKSRSEASLVYLRNGQAKDYKTKVLQDFLLQEGISHEDTKDTALNQMDWPRD